MRIVRSFHENDVFLATYGHILPNEKYRKYPVIIVSKPKISCNIVWTLKKDIAEGWSRHHRLTIEGCLAKHQTFYVIFFVKPSQYQSV